METTGTDEVEKLKTKFISAWHNMKYSWVLKTKTYFSRSSPVFLLGKCYHFKSDETNEYSQDMPNVAASVGSEDISGNVEEFRKDFISRIWLTYREEFPPLEGSASALTTDCGWGCTLRTGQMLLAQGLLLHFLGREWTWPGALEFDNSESDSWTIYTARKLAVPFEASLSQDTVTSVMPNFSTKIQRTNGMAQEIDIGHWHRKIISWFADCPAALFGLHQLTEHGKNSGKMAGDWYGPAVVAHLLRKSVEDATDPALEGLTIYVAQDCTVYSGDVFDKQCSSFGSEKAVIILVPVRLGGERTNMEYFEFVKGILSLEYSVGIIGGKPKQSYYFIGFQDDSLIYMDPHYCQSFVDVSIKDFPLESFHCSSPKKMTFKKMDPSCTIGFYCRNVEDFEKVAEEITKVVNSSSKEKYPLFTFVKGHSRDYDFWPTPVHEQNDLLSEEERKRLQRFNAEEFVLL